MKYYKDREDALVDAEEKIAEAAEVLEELLPEAAEEIGWIRENIREEILSVRTVRVAQADGAYEEGDALDFR